MMSRVPDSTSASRALYSFDQSVAYHAEASGVIAGGVNSNARLQEYPAPLCVARAHGAHLIDIDGNDYVDYALGMGPAILGHAPQSVIDAVARTLARGQLYAGQSRLELELGRRMQQHVPAAELIRIGMTGSEMVQVSLRLARAATERTHFIKFAGHYHGWLDSVLTNEMTFFAGPPTRVTPATPQTRGQTAGSVAETTVLPWNDLATLRTHLMQFGESTAAIIMEPVMCNTGVIPPAPGYLEGVRELCNEHGIILIIDEVITGFRLGLSGAQGFFGVEGDLAVFAKALGGGFPIAVLAGRRSLMSLFGSGNVNHQGTYNSNVIALSAAIATLDVLAAERGVVYSRIEAMGQALIEGMRSIARTSGDNLIVQGYPSVFHTSFGDAAAIATLEAYRQCDAARLRRFLNALLARGIRPNPRGTWFVSAAHTAADVDATLAAVRGALAASR